MLPPNVKADPKADPPILEKIYTKADTDVYKKWTGYTECLKTYPANDTDSFFASIDLKSLSKSGSAGGPTEVKFEGLLD